MTLPQYSTPRPFTRDDPSTWPSMRPLIIAHDVGRSRDRSTAVIGGNSPFQPRLLGIQEAEELPPDLFGSVRASALAAIDRRYYANALIVADLCRGGPSEFSVQSALLPHSSARPLKRPAVPKSFAIPQPFRSFIGTRPTATLLLRIKDCAGKKSYRGELIRVPKAAR